MKYFIKYGAIALIPFITIGLISTVMRSAKDKTLEMTEDVFEIRLPKALSVLFFVVFGFFGTLMVLMATIWNNETAVWYIYLCFGGFAFVGLFYGIFILRCKVVVRGETVEIYPMIGRPKVYQFSQITHVEYHPNPDRMENMVKVYAASKKLFAFSEMYIGYEYIYERLQAAGLIK